jgi:acetyltransferase-like isoleucine patch superfamily enzyme
VCDRIDASARTGEGFVHGTGVVIEADVVIGDDVRLGDHVVIARGTELGDGVVVSDLAVVGKRPALSKRSTAKAGELTDLVVGEGCVIGSHTVLMAGSRIGRGTIVGDCAGVRERCTIGEEVVVGRSVTVENDTVVGDRTKIQSGAYITAYMDIGSDCFIGPMVVTTNDNYMGRTKERFKHLKGPTIRRGARIGGGAHLLPGIDIGEEAFIATGAVVTRDVSPGTVVMGVPAREARAVPDEELLENQ